MKNWIAAVILASALMFGSRSAINPSAAAAPSRAAVQEPRAQEASDPGARRRSPHRVHDVYRPYYRPYYYDRPYYYAPAPFFPFLGLGYGPWW